MKFSKWVFRIGGVYGLLALIPHYFLEAQITAQRGAFIYPEYFYGFVGVGIAWQVAFLMIARDPARFRLMIIPGIIEKVSFAVAAFLLYSKGRTPSPILVPASIDVVLALLFFISYLKLMPAPQTA